MKKFSLYVALAVLGTLPGLVMRLTHRHGPPLLETLVFFAAILGASFLLSWGAEAAEEHVSQGLAIGLLALVTVLPEYAVDIYYTFRAGQHPGSDYVQFAAANMTGANRLLIGTAWPLVVLLFWWRSGKRSVALRWENAAEVAFLALASLYSFVITLKGRIDLWDTLVLVGIFVAYLWRLSRLPRDEDDDDDEEVGPAAALAELPRGKQYAIMAALTVFAALVILASAEPFAESLIVTGATLGINKFLLIQWVAPLAGEAPEIIITVLFCLSLKPTAALGVVQTARTLDLIRRIRDTGVAVILISHNMPNVFETADRIHIQRLGGRAAVITPESHSMQDAVAIMTGAMTVPDNEQTVR